MTQPRPLRTAAAILVLTLAAAVVMRFQLSMTERLLGDYGASGQALESLPPAPADPAAVPLDTAAVPPEQVGPSGLGEPGEEAL